MICMCRHQQAEFEERDGEEKLPLLSSSPAPWWIRLRGQKHEMRGAGGRWRHSSSHDSFQAKPISNDLQQHYLTPLTFTESRIGTYAVTKTRKVGFRIRIFPPYFANPSL